jgi:tRNA (guanine37-N1)-methyltransferase
LKYLRIEKQNGQKLLDLIKKSNKKIINPNYRIEYEDDFIFFPLNSGDLIDVNSDFSELRYKIVKRIEKSRIQKRKRNLVDYLSNTLPDEILQLMPKSYDIIGEIAIIEFDRFDKIKTKDLTFYKKKIAEALIKVNSSVKNVYEKKSEISGKFRLRELGLILGFDKSETLYKENKTVYKLDVQKVFFSPRLVNERKRISQSTFFQDEMIVDMFAGVGPFSIQIAKINPVKVFAFDINPVAFRYLKENIKINNVNDKVNCFNLDVKDLIKPENEIGNKIHNKIDRVIMNLPEMSFNFLDVTCYLMKQSGGILHFYSFADKDNSFVAVCKKLKHHLGENHFKIDRLLNQRVVKAFSPKMDLIGIDCVIKSK